MPSIPKKPKTKGKKSTYTLTGWGLHKNDTIQETIGNIINDIIPLYEQGFEVTCSDGKVRKVRPILGGWVADYKEYHSLFQVKNNSCVNC